MANALGTALTYAPQVMGFFSDLFGGSSNSAAASLAASMALQNHQYELNRKTRQTAYQDTRYSLESAGYNPLLAVGQQAQGGTFGASMNVQDPKSENLQNALNKATAFGQLKLNSAQAYNQLMQGNLTLAQANSLNTQSKLNSAQTGLVNLQRNAQAIQNLHLPAYLKSQILLNNNQAQASIMNAQSNQVSANASMMNANTNASIAPSAIASNRASAYRNRTQSPGYSTSVNIGPFGFSHSGNNLIK